MERVWTWPNHSFKPTPTVRCVHHTLVPYIQFYSVIALCLAATCGHMHSTRVLGLDCTCRHGVTGYHFTPGLHTWLGHLFALAARVPARSKHLVGADPPSVHTQVAAQPRHAAGAHGARGG